jgi:DNA polymerase V
MKKNIYVLIDCDNFYVSCERIFRPDLRNKPVVVLSNNDGCIVSRSNEAKELGIQMGTPYFKIEDLADKNAIHVFSSNYSLYADISQRIVNVLEKFSQDIEVYSIDESFLKLSMDENKCQQYAVNIRETILTDVGIPTTLGIAYTKTLTKVASKIAKKDCKYKGVLSLLSTKDNDMYLERIEVDDIWGVGRKYSKLLKTMGICTAKDLKYVDKRLIRKKMTVNGYRTVMELNNIECIPFQESPPKKKSIVNSRSFGALTSSLSDIKEALAMNVTRAGEKLRKEDCVAAFMTVFVTTSPFRKPYYSKSIGVKLPYPVSDSSTLIKYAFFGLDKIFKKGYLYKKSGVMLTDICPLNHVQLNFAANEFLDHLENNEKIMNSVDYINTKWGKDTVKIASLGTKNKLRMKQCKKSPRYTSSWEELLVVNI